MSLAPARVLIVMLGRGRGGIEQAALDQARLLKASGHAVKLVLSRNAAIAMDADAVDAAALRQAGRYDFFAAWRVREIAREFAADVILCNGRRAFALTGLARAPRVLVAHNYLKPDRWRRADAVITVSAALRDIALANGVAAHKAFAVPNAIATPEAAPARAPFKNPPIIGAFGRHVPKKGFQVLLDALAQLRSRGVDFRAVTGGDGELRETLMKHADDAGLGDVVSFPGWVDDKAAFFADCDIFCIPSLHEPFGIIVLEALAAGAPLIVARSEGPSEILDGAASALLVETGDPASLAAAIEYALANEPDMRERARRGFDLVKNNYADSAVAARLSDAVNQIADRVQKSAP